MQTRCAPELRSNEQELPHAPRAKLAGMHPSVPPKNEFFHPKRGFEGGVYDSSKTKQTS